MWNSNWGLCLCSCLCCQPLYLPLGGQYLCMNQHWNPSLLYLHPKHEIREIVAWHVKISCMFVFPNARKVSLNGSLEATFVSYNFLQSSSAFHNTRIWVGLEKNVTCECDIFLNTMLRYLWHRSTLVFLLHLGIHTNNIIVCVFKLCCS